MPSTPTLFPARSRPAGQAEVWVMHALESGGQARERGMSGTLRNPTALITAPKGETSTPDEVTISYSPRSATQLTLSIFSPSPRWAGGRTGRPRLEVLLQLPPRGVGTRPIGAGKRERVDVRLESTSAPGYRLADQVPPTPGALSKIVKPSIPSRFRATAAAMPLKPAPMMATRVGGAAEPAGRGTEFMKVIR